MLRVLKTTCAIRGYLDNKGKDSFTFKATDITHSAESGCATCRILRDSLAHARPKFIHEVGEVKVEKGKDGPLVLTYLIKGSPAQESIEIYSHAGAPTAYSWVGIGEEISIDGSSDDCFKLIKSWIQDCATNHPQCSVDQSPELPTRVIDVGSVSQPPRLRISQLERAKYIALSHCWGPPEKAAVTIKTTASTLQQFQAEIPWSSLTKTFRDAISITRRLGIQYLWIDSLCIIQGDTQDWAIESSKMTTVYSNAFIVVCASGASDGDQGCFIRNRSASAEGVLRMECQGLKDTTSFVYARRSRRGIHFTLAEMRGGEYSHGWKSAMGQPLETRAWTFQEEELATRILFYTEDEVQWRCCKVNACECRGARELKGKGHLRLRQSQRSGQNAAIPAGSMTGGLLSDGAKQFPYQDVVDWYFIVAEYTRRDMTYMSDRLPGLSGIAGHWERAENDTYHAGLWQKNLPHHLLWWAHAVGLGAPARGSLRHPAYYAPTWSWASITGGIQHLREPGEIHVRVVDVQTEPATINRFGSVKRGNLVLSAILIPVSLTREQPTPFSAGKMIKAVDARPDREHSDLGSILPDVQTTAGDSEIDVHELHYLLPNTNINVDINTTSPKGIIYTGIAGRLDFDPSSPAYDQDSVSWLASMSKLATAVSLLQLVERGIISLDDDINSTLQDLAALPVLRGFETDGKSWKRKGGRLLSHTLDIGVDMADPDLIQWSKSTNRRINYMSYTLEGISTPLKFAPGEGWYYGTAYDWAGHLLANLMRSCLSSYMQENIFGPLDMASTKFRLEDINDFAKRRLAFAYSETDDKGSVVLKPDPSPLPAKRKEGFEAGGSGLFSTPGDYGRLLHGILPHRILSAESTDLLFTPQLNDAQRGILMAIAEYSRAGGFTPELPANCPLNHGLAGFLNTVDVAGKRHAGSMM
ncbi:hypothetical protein GQX73_g9968 [Xylaria multiplex]|uniref:Beta-lactamase-related domain-containing protein n=1 Tax=Xylaria multiplex TaxID=323545 RepID=A0A7C8ILT1_9PEZI|nr:hypothetical protein GQX73_g9968 [Xylaria multiplex]